MKLDLHGIRFRFWLATILLACGVTLFLGALQVGYIGPYYRNAKMKTLQGIASDIAYDLTEDGSESGIASALKQTVNNELCTVMYNSKGEVVYSADSLGVGCIFNASASRQPSQLQDMDVIIDGMNDKPGDYSLQFVSDVTGENMIVYGTKVEAPLSTYYLFINTSLNPATGMYRVFITQYFAYTVVVIIVASFVAMVFSGKITKPIVNMRKEAEKLSNADYSAHFDGGSFTETRALASTLNRANESMSRIDELRRDLIANLSHDIRTPLTDIRAYAEMIRDISGDNPAKREKHLNVIIRETEYLSMLINDLNQLTAMQSGNIEVNEEEIDLSARIREIIELNRTLIHNAGIILHLDIPDTLNVVTDETKIGRVIQNYLTNAIKHTPKGESITVRAYEKRHTGIVRIEVEDRGEGIPEEEIPFIWDRYYKSSRTFQRNMKSTGLGLAIVKSIAETMHASYGVKSQVDKGSVFWFEFNKKGMDKE